MHNKYPMGQQWGCGVCCHRQIFEEIYANLSLKVPIFVLFCPTKYVLKSLVPPFQFHPPQHFFQVSLFLIFKIWIPLPFLKEGTHCDICRSFHQNIVASQILFLCQIYAKGYASSSADGPYMPILHRKKSPLLLWDVVRIFQK